MSVFKRNGSGNYYIQFNYRGKTYVKSSRTTNKRTAERMEREWRDQIHAMLEMGAAEELKSLRQKWPLSAQMPSMRCIGYRQLWCYLENEISLEEMRDQAVAATRQLAKRQLTWLRHYPETKLLDPYSSSTEDISQQIIYQLQ